MIYDGSDRPRGILAPVDRDFLAGIREYDTRQEAYNRRKQIRERTANGIRDFWLLANELDDDEIEKIAADLSVDDSFHPLIPAPQHLRERDPLDSAFAIAEPGEVLRTSKQFHRGAASTIAFLYRLYGDDSPAFEELVSDGVASALQHFREGEWRVDVDIDPVRVEQVDYDEALEKLESGNPEELTDKEREILLEHLVEEDAIDIDGLRMPSSTKIAWKPVDEDSDDEGDDGDESDQ